MHLLDMDLLTRSHAGSRVPSSVCGRWVKRTFLLLSLPRSRFPATCDAAAEQLLPAASTEEAYAQHFESRQGADAFHGRLGTFVRRAEAVGPEKEQEFFRLGQRSPGLAFDDTQGFPFFQDRLIRDRFLHGENPPQQL